MRYGPLRLVEFPLKTEGEFVLDFNYAYLPPCAFSLAYNCPLPPQAK
ncbi:DUF1684 domain-containing protein [Paenibacillus filicis]